MTLPLPLYASFIHAIRPCAYLKATDTTATEIRKWERTQNGTQNSLGRSNVTAGHEWRSCMGLGDGSGVLDIMNYKG